MIQPLVKDDSYIMIYLQWAKNTLLTSASVKLLPQDCGDKDKLSKPKLGKQPVDGQ